MTGIEEQVLAYLRKKEGAGTAEVAQKMGVSVEFAQTVIDRLSEDGRIVRADDGSYALSADETRKPAPYRRLEARRKPLVRW